MVFSLQATAIFSDPNQNPFGAYAAAHAAPGTAPVEAPKSLEWNGNVDDPNAKVIRLRDRLNEADTERRKDEEAALARERAAEIRREERLRKIAYMQSMPDNEPAGTGKWPKNKSGTRKSMNALLLLTPFFFI